MPPPHIHSNREGETSSTHRTPLGAFGASILAPAALDLGGRFQFLDPPLPFGVCPSSTFLTLCEDEKNKAREIRVVYNTAVATEPM